MDLIDPAVNDYLLEHAPPADEVLRELAAETAERLPEFAEMQIAQDEGALLTMLARLTDARRAVEVGVFTGYSSICIARGMAPGGQLIACDVNQEWTSIARRYWDRAGVADKIDLRLAPAADTLRALPHEAHLDFAFIDADKPGYPVYYEELVTRMRPGGLIVMDNVLRSGRVLDPAYSDPGDVAMRQINATVHVDPRVDAVMLAVRDGITLIRKR